MSDKLYFDAYIVVSKRYTNNQPVLFLRVDGYDYWSKKLGRHAELCDYIELPHGMTRKEVLCWLTTNFADNAIYQQAVNARGQRAKKALTAEEQLEAIRQRVLRQRAVMEELQQQELAIQQLLAVVKE